MAVRLHVYIGAGSQQAAARTWSHEQEGSACPVSVPRRLRRGDRFRIPSHRGRRHRRRRIYRNGQKAAAQRADPGDELGPVHRRSSVNSRGLLSRPRRIRLLPKRRRQLLRRVASGGKATEAAAARRRPLGELRGADGNVVGVYQVQALEAGNRRQRHHRRDRRRRRGEPRRGHLQAHRQAGRQTGRGIREPDDQTGPARTRPPSSTPSPSSSASRRSAAAASNGRRTGDGAPRGGGARDSCTGRQRVGRRLRRRPGRPDRLRRPGGHRHVTMVCVPDLMAAYQQGTHRPRGRQGRAAGDDRPLRAHGRPDRDPRPAPGLNAQQIREWRVDKAGYDSKYAALYWPWVKVFDPATGKNILVPPSGHMAGIWGRNDNDPRRPQGPGQRGRPRRHLPRGQHHEERARPAQPERDQLHPRASPAAASGSGAPARCRATRPGATSTCAGSSTTWRSPS